MVYEMPKDNNKKANCLRGKFNYSNYKWSYALSDDIDRNKISAQV